MTIRCRQSQSGIALIIVLIVMVVLGGLAIRIAYAMKIETKLARNSSFEPELEWMARSGVELAKYIISHESSGPFGQADSLKKYWAGGPGETNDFITMIPLKNHPIDKGFVDISVVDLDRKININMADKLLLNEALDFVVPEDAVLKSTIIDSIIDWRDRDDATGPSGAESDDYTSDPNPGYPPYIAKNGPIDDMSELLMIRGVTPQIFWGPKAGVYSTLRKKRSGFEQPIPEVGLSDIFTAISGGRVNINTVNERVLQAIPGIDSILASEILRPRKGLDGQDGTSDDMPLANVGSLGALMPGGGGPAPVPGAPQAGPMGALAQYVSVRSMIFEVTVDARIGGIKKRYVALLRRNGPKDIQTITMYSQ